MAIDSAKRHGSVDDVLRWIGDLDHPFYDDERQRFVWYEASAIGFQLALFLALIIGPLAALIAPVEAGPLIGLTTLPAVLAAGVVAAYSAARGAPFMASRDDLRRPRLYLLVVPVVLLAVMIGRLGDFGLSAGGASGFTVVLAVAGVLGVAAGIGGALWSGRQVGGDPHSNATGRGSSESNRLDRVLRWIGDLDHPFYNEERQRFVWYEASAIGFQLMLVLQLALTGIALVTVGRDAIPALIIGLVPLLVVAVVVTGYAQRRGARYFPQARDLKRSRGLLGIALLVIQGAGMVRVAFDAPADQSGFMAGFSTAAPLGFAVGIVAAIAGGWFAHRRNIDADSVEVE